jgi:hypothetical protein
MANAFMSTVGKQYSDATKEADAAISRVDRVTDTIARPTPGQPTDGELEDELDIVLRESEEPATPFAEPTEPVRGNIEKILPATVVSSLASTFLNTTDSMSDSEVAPAKEESVAPSVSAEEESVAPSVPAEEELVAPSVPAEEELVAPSVPADEEDAALKEQPTTTSSDYLLRGKSASEYRLYHLILDHLVKRGSSNGDIKSVKTMVYLSDRNVGEREIKLNGQTISVEDLSPLGVSGDPKSIGTMGISGKEDPYFGAAGAVRAASKDEISDTLLDDDDDAKQLASS